MASGGVGWVHDHASQAPLAMLLSCKARQAGRGGATVICRAWEGAGRGWCGVPAHLWLCRPACEAEVLLPAGRQC